MNRPGQTDQILLAAFLAVLAFPLLFAARSLDTNTLTNWQWVFREASAPATFLLVAAVTVLAFFLSRAEPGPRSYPAVLFLASVASVLPLWSEPELILDAARYFSQAKHLELYGAGSFLREWGTGISAWTDLPAVPFLYGTAFRHLGETRAVVQAVTTLLFALAAVSLFRIGRTLWSEETGFLAGLMLLGSPYLLTQVPLMLVDVSTMALLTFSLDAFLAAVLTGGPGRMALATALIVATVFAKFSAWLMLPVLPLAAFVMARRGDPAAGRRALIVLGAAALIAGTLLAAQHRVVRDQLALLREYQLPGLGRWRESTFSTLLFQIHPFVTLLAAFGMIAALRKKDVAAVVPAWSVLFVLALGIERIRYMLPLFPLFALLAAYGLRELSAYARVRRFFAFSAAGASLVLVLFAYLPFLNSTTMANLRDAGRYLDGLPGEAVEVRVLPQRWSVGNTEAAVPILDLFTRKRIVFRQEQRHRPPEERVLTSPLRFTWETRLPSWYTEGAAAAGLPLVVISSGDDPLPQNAGGRRFGADTGTFRFRTVLTVLGPDALARTAQ